jgi:hypothetical protein
LSRERKIKRKSMCMEKKERKKERNFYMWMKEEKEKEKDEVAMKIWEGWIKWKKNKVQGMMSRCWETKLPLFFQPCAIRQRGRHQCL